MPGISISTSVRTGPTTDTVRESSQAFFVGKAERGPIDTAVKVYSLEDFQNNFGGYVSYGYLHPVVESFFEEGGTQCYIARVVGPGADAPGFVTFDDGAADAITFTAVGPGDWCEDVEIKIEAGTAASTKKVTLKYKDVVVFSTGNCLTNAQIIGKFANSVVASRLVTATAEAGGFVANSAYTPLATSDDDVASVTATHLATGLDLFNDAYGTGMVSCPELADEDTLREALVVHANTYNRLAILHGEAGLDSEDAIDLAQSIQADIVDNLEHAALYHPWVYAPTSVSGVNRLIPPDGYVCGIRARAHNQVGPQRPYAGLISNAKFITGVESEIDTINGDLLDAESVNAIRVIANNVRIYGARSLSSDTSNFRYITAQDIVNHVVVESYRTLEDVVFTVIDGRNNVFVTIAARLVAVLEPLRASGALFEAFTDDGQRIDYGYTVKCDKGLNPITQLAEGLVSAKVGLRVSSVGDRIEVNIVKSNLTGSVV